MQHEQIIVSLAFKYYTVPLRKMSILSLPQQSRPSSKSRVHNMNPKEALKTAQESDNVDTSVETVLETELDRIWIKVQTQPSSYIMDQTEFGIFNRYRSQPRFQNETARSAVARYWDSKTVANSH